MSLQHPHLKYFHYDEGLRRAELIGVDDLAHHEVYRRIQHAYCLLDTKVPLKNVHQLCELTREAFEESWEYIKHLFKVVRGYLVHERWDALYRVAARKSHAFDHINETPTKSKAHKRPPESYPQNRDNPIKLNDHPPTPQAANDASDPDKRGARGGGDKRFREWFAHYPNNGSNEDYARRQWKRRGLDTMADQLIADVQARKNGEWCGRHAESIPRAVTYLKEAHWLRENPPPQRQLPGILGSVGSPPSGRHIPSTRASELAEPPPPPPPPPGSVPDAVLRMAATIPDGEAAPRPGESRASHRARTGALLRSAGAVLDALTATG